MVLDILDRAHVEVVGMEKWTAGIEPTVDYCVQHARKSDVLLGIIGHRYGWIPEGQEKSITELEYDAQPRRLMFIVDNSVPPDPTSLDAPMHTKEFHQAQVKLHEFKKRISEGDNRACTFKSDEELQTLVTQAVFEWLQRNENGGTSDSTTTSVSIQGLTPARVYEKLRANERAMDGLREMLSNVTPLLEQSSECLDDNSELWRYVRQRMIAADAMIADSTWDRLTTADMACLLAAVI